MIDWDKNVLAALENVFGEPVQYMPAVGAPFPITGIFDEAYKEVDLAGGMGANSVMPVLGVRLSQFSNPPLQGDQLTILRTGGTYIVKKPEPDSHGSILLKLNYLGP